MKKYSLKELQNNGGRIMREDLPVAITRRGQVSAYLVGVDAGEPKTTSITNQEAYKQGVRDVWDIISTCRENDWTLQDAIRNITDHVLIKNYLK